MMFFISLGLILYSVGLINCVIINKKNLLVFLVSSEFMFLGLNLLLIAFGFIFHFMDAVVISFMIFVMTVGESAVGLGLSIVCFKLIKSVNVNDFNKLKY